MVAGIKSEWWPTSNRNPRPDCLGIRTKEDAPTGEPIACEKTLLNGAAENVRLKIEEGARLSDRQ
jgi:hypothetical protein